MCLSVYLTHFAGQNRPPKSGCESLANLEPQFEGHGAPGARAYNGGMGTEPPAGSRAEPRRSGGQVTNPSEAVFVHLHNHVRVDQIVLKFIYFCKTKHIVGRLGGAWPPRL